MAYEDAPFTGFHDSEIEPAPAVAVTTGAEGDTGHATAFTGDWGPEARPCTLNALKIRSASGVPSVTLPLSSLATSMAEYALPAVPARYAVVFGSARRYRRSNRAQPSSVPYLRTKDCESFQYAPDRMWLSQWHS